MTDHYKEYACEFKNEAECEEELDSVGYSSTYAERIHYEDGDE